MDILSAYLHRPHPADCDCSVCFVARMGPVLPSRSECFDCQPPGRPYKENGRWLCRPRSFCAKHDPARRPPQYWYECANIGKPVPFVPIREPFELEG